MRNLYKALTGAGLLLCACDSSPVDDGDMASTTSGAVVPQTCEAAGQPQGSESGEFFPDARVTACDGTKVTLDEIRCEHELTWISVGAAWCGPCQEEAPDLQAAHVQFGEDGVGIVQILFQGPSSAPATTLDCANWREQYALTLPVYADPVGTTVIGFDGGAAQTPLNLVVDRDGEVLWSHTGQLEEGGIEATIETLLGR